MSAAERMSGRTVSACECVRARVCECIIYITILFFIPHIIKLSLVFFDSK